MAESEGGDLDVFVTITAKQGARQPLTIKPKTTATQLRKQVSEATEIPLSGLRLIYRGKMIKDDDEKEVVSAYKLEKECVIHCMGKPDAQAMANPNSASAATNTAAAAVAAAPSTTAAANTTATTTEDPVKAAIALLRRSNPPAMYQTAVITLDKVLSNVISNPLEEKYRKVKKQNPAFQKRLGGLVGGDAAMKASGFVVQVADGVESYVLEATPEAWPRLTAAKATIEQAVTEAKTAASAPPAPMGLPGFNGLPNGNPMGGVNPFGMPGGAPNAAMTNPQMRNAVASIMSNPQALGQMLQDPRLQQMIQNDPNVSPMMRQSMQQIASNPAMLSQLSQMMNDPNMRSQLESMIGGGGGGGAFGGNGAMPGGFMGGGAQQQAPPGQQQQQQQQGGANSSNNDGANDQDQTEEEMIAEAIRRSMNER
eukprot:CAMPEP_0119548142 /NCGR_PEP_ID=MMETSP1352-20130426/2133_1 /TAXON_ID=265584 /ORGANISM="Stauroneis constricta, Strain CCMP1120" /LENGTH=424 /DNA_ID=CAMNT_0007593327 /DNA_START=35 /DNA_END=1312 /DNA_ORIENTATION=+